MILVHLLPLRIQPDKDAGYPWAPKPQHTWLHPWFLFRDLPRNGRPHKNGLAGRYSQWKMLEWMPEAPFRRLRRISMRSLQTNCPPKVPTAQQTPMLKFLRSWRTFPIPRRCAARRETIFLGDERPNPPVCRVTRLFIHALRPQYALILFRDGAQAFVNKLLNPLAAIRPGHVDISLGIGGNAVRAVKFTGLAAAFSKRGKHFQRIARKNVDPVILSIRQINIFLLRIFRECDVPRRARAQRPLGDEGFLHKSAVGFEH